MAIATAEEPTVPGPAADRHCHPAGPVAALLGVLGVGYRLAMLLTEVPPTNSDEATSGLVALHIAQGRELPLFFYGQYYMGALESYLAAPFFVALGPSIGALRLPNLLLYAVFLVLTWQLTRRLYHPWLAAFTIGLLALGSDRILKNQLIAGGGYPEMNPAGVLLVLLAVNLGLGVIRRRALAFAAWGLIAGLTLWDDWLILPYVGAAAAVLFAFNWRELCGRAGLVFGGALLIGLIPIVAHNVTAAAGDRSLAVYANLGGGQSASWADRLYGGVLFGLPMGTGLCSPSRCEAWQLWWAVVYPVLLGAAVALAVRALRAGVGRVERVRQAGRLALQGGAALSLLAYATSSAAGNTPVESARYLSVLSISTPVVLWPLWAAASGRSWRAPRLTVLAGLTGLAALAVTLVAATVSVLGRVPAMAESAAQRRALVTELDRLGVDRIYSEYWTCNNIIFLTRERIICAVLRDDLRAGWDRYPPYPDLVAQARRPAYVLPTGSPLSAAVAAHLRDAGGSVTATAVAGYDIYRTSGRADLPRN